MGLGGVRVVLGGVRVGLSGVMVGLGGVRVAMYYYCGDSVVFVRCYTIVLQRLVP